MKKLILLSSLLCLHAFLYAQGVVVTGTVTDEAGESLPGVNVVKQGTTVGTITDLNGSYQLQIEDSQNATLVFSSVGFISQEISVGTKSSIDIVLSSDITQLEEIVVSAFGLEREAKSVAYARQAVDTETMTEARTSNFINSLSGKAAGVQVVNSSTPTGSSRVVIRGLTSVTGNNAPLYVVDGIPLGDAQGDASVSVWNSGDDIDYGSPISQLNPDDIENIEVLKGPNAAALYGSRASNGVVLITTKKGAKKNGIGVSVNSNTQFTSNSEYPYYQYVYGSGNNGRLISNQNQFDSETGLPAVGSYDRSYGAPMLGQQVMGYNGLPMDYVPNLDNVKELYQTGVMLTNGVAVDKAYQGGSFRLGYTYTTSEFTIANMEKQKRHNLSYRGTQEISNALKLDASILYTNDNVENRLYRNGSERNPANNYMYMKPDMSMENLSPYKMENGEAFRYRGPFNNPLWNLYENSNFDNSNRIIGSVALNWEILEGLSLRGKAMGDVNLLEGEEFNNMGAAYDADGYYRTFNRNLQNWNYEALLNYNKTFDKISVTAIAGANKWDLRSTGSETRIQSLLVPGVKSVSNSNTVPEVRQSARNKTVNSVFGSLSVGFNGTIYLDATARNDWSSTLPADNNSYFYPSIGTSFIFSELLPSSNLFSFGKARVSYAQVGNDTDPYRVLTTYGYGGNYNNTAWLALQGTRNNPTLRPELTSSWEYGIELNFLSNRISLNGTYYNSSTIDQIIPAQTSSATGFQSQIFNAGEIQSKGWEMFLSAKAIDKEFKWDIMLNLAQNESMVVELVPGVDRLLLREWFNVKVWAEVGKPLGEIRGDTKVIDEETGYRLVQANGRNIWQPDQVLGNAQPKLIGGLNNRFQYKGFSMSFLFDFKYGGDVYSATMLKAMNFGMRGETYEGRDEYFFSNVILGESGQELRGNGLFGNDYADAERPKGRQYENAALGEKDENGEWVAKRDEDGNVMLAGNLWTNPQQINYDPIRDQELITYDASFVKFRELVFGYNFPNQWLDKTPLQTARVSFVGRNLLVVYKNTPQGIDPESNTTSGNGQGIEYASFLPTRTLGFNINLTF